MLIPRTVTPRTSQRRSRWAAALVEFAITAPLFFTLILGIVEIGRAYMVTHLLNNAARRGCRVGIIPGTSTSTITTNVTNSLAGMGINGQSATVTVNDGTADASTASTGDEITVKVSVPMSSVSWLPSMNFANVTLRGQYTLRRE